MAGTGQELARRNGRAPATVDPEDEPSVAWGWHGGFPRGTVIAGWFSAILLLLMTIGNHEGHIEDIYLVCIGVGIIIALLYQHYKRRRAWRN